MTVSRPDFREAMARLGAAVNVVTSDGPAGRSGMTASAVCSVSDDPATLLICINRNSNQNANFKANGVFCVNVLAAEQRMVSNVFSGATGASGADRFSIGEWGTLITGAPVLAGATVALDCEIEEVMEKGTHTVFFAAIKAIHLGEPGPALIWWQRDYHQLGQTAV